MYIEAATGLPIAAAMAEQLHRIDRKKPPSPNRKRQQWVT
jgi:hypothetical protein